jgi:hypothetical protein
MIRRAVVLCVCLLLPGAVAADPLVSFAEGFVTWEASGVIERSSTIEGHPFLAHVAVGTPFAMTVTFNPSAAFPQSEFGFPANPDCLAVEFSGSLTLGSTTYGGGTGQGFTNAMLPGDTCAGTELTQFTFFGAPLTSPDGTTFSDVYGSAVIVASYRDLLIQDAFPEVPTGGGLFFMNLTDSRGANGSFTWRVADVEQPAPVPEPGTLTLFALGAAAVARRVRAQRRG